MEWGRKSALYDKSYSVGKNSMHVLKGIDVHIKEGELVSIMGSSGSGKSTLIKCITGLIGNYMGEIVATVTGVIDQTPPETELKQAVVAHWQMDNPGVAAIGPGVLFTFPM